MGKWQHCYGDKNDNNDNYCCNDKIHSKEIHDDNNINGNDYNDNNIIIADAGVGNDNADDTGNDGDKDINNYAHTNEHNYHNSRISSHSSKIQI